MNHPLHIATTGPTPVWAINLPKAGNGSTPGMAAAMQPLAHHDAAHRRRITEWRTKP